MAAQPTPATSDQGDEPGAGRDDVAHPLSAYVHGVLAVHFKGGAVVTRECSQFDARAFLTKQQGEERSDAITWQSSSWFHWASSQVVFSSFDSDRDQNWTVTTEDRRRLTEAGHPVGVIASLVDFWDDRGRRAEPSYSLNAIVLLHQVARDGLDRTTWEAVARAYEGSRGAARLAVARRDAPVVGSLPVDISGGGKAGENLRADDEAQPEDAPPPAPKADPTDASVDGGDLPDAPPRTEPSAQEDADGQGSE